MRKSKAFKRLEFTCLFARSKEGLEPFHLKTIRSLLKDYGKSIPKEYKKIRKIYNVIKIGYNTKRKISRYITGKYCMFEHTSYNIQYLLLRGLVDRVRHGREHSYFITGRKCGYNTKYERLLYKRW